MQVRMFVFKIDNIIFDEWGGPEVDKHWFLLSFHCAPLEHCDPEKCIF